MEGSIRKMKEVIEKCDKSIAEYGDTAHVFMNRIKTYYPFTVEDGRFVAIPAKGLKYRLEKEIGRLEKRLEG